MNNAVLFLLFLVSVAFGLAWLYAVSPLLIGLPATWANAPMLLVTLPTWVAFAVGFAAQHHIR